MKTVSSLPDDFWNIEEEEEGGVEDDDFGFTDTNKMAATEEEEEEMETEGETDRKTHSKNSRAKSHDSAAGQSELSMDGIESMEQPGSNQLPEDTVSNITQCLEELRKCLENAEQDIVSRSVQAHTHTHSHTLTLTHTHSHTHTRVYTHTHTSTHTHTHTGAASYEVVPHSHSVFPRDRHGLLCKYCPYVSCS